MTDARLVRATSLAAVVVLLAACRGGERAPATDTSAAAQASALGTAATPATPATPGAAKPACERTGHWIPCQVRQRLERSGLAPRDTSASDLPTLGPTPTVFRIGKGSLAVYLFADSAARARAATSLDTVKFVAAERPLTMLSRATVIQNDNLLALLFSKNDQQRERVSDALMAGPPQP
ncbi:MAG TPA: hypothetical protein VF461_01355 [Gemmatimonadaceae bacterium]